jgi:serine/threonine-protein kinase
VRHPNFVHPVDTLSHEGDLYGATEFALGVRLDELRQAAAAEHYELPLAVSLRIVVDALAGLSALHASGANSAGSRAIVHGDVAPTNVFITASGETRIVHSGLSSVTSRAGVIAARNRRLGYKAPEQLRAGVNAVPIGPAADVFAAGVLLWEALQGARLFDDPTDVEVVEHILYGQIPPFDPNGARYMPIALLPLVTNALERNPDIRTPNAATLAAAIERAPGVHLATIQEVADLVGELMGPFIQRRLARIEDLVARSGQEATSEGSLRPVAAQGRPLGSMRTPVGFVFPPPSSFPPSRAGVSSSAPPSSPPPRAGSSPGFDTSTRASYRTPIDSRIVPPRLSRTFPPSSRTPSSSRSLGAAARTVGSAKSHRPSGGASWAYYLAIGAAAGVVVFSLLRVVMGTFSIFGGNGSTESAQSPATANISSPVVKNGSAGERVSANPMLEPIPVPSPAENSAAANAEPGPPAQPSASGAAAAKPIVPPNVKPLRVPAKASNPANIPQGI